MGSLNVLEAVNNCNSVKSLVYITSDKCYWNNEFGVDEQERDQKVQNMLEISQIDYQFFDEQIFI